MFIAAILLLGQKLSETQARDVAVFEAILTAGAPSIPSEIRLLDSTQAAKRRGDLVFGQPEPRDMRLKSAERRGLLARNKGIAPLGWFVPKAPWVRIFPRKKFKPYSDDGHYVWFLLPAYSADHLSAVVARGNSLNVRYGYSYVWLKCVKGSWQVVRTKYLDLT